jgi:hypothetical protein
MWEMPKQADTKLAYSIKLYDRTLFPSDPIKAVAVLYFRPIIEAKQQ